MNTDNNHLGNRIYIVFIGLLNTLFAFSGYEAGARNLIYFFFIKFSNFFLDMSEETKNATISAPRGILYTVIATALDGFLIILGNI